jgi:hypothetical protein
LDRLQRRRPVGEEFPETIGTALRLLIASLERAADAGEPLAREMLQYAEDHATGGASAVYLPDLKHPALEGEVYFGPLRPSEIKTFILLALALDERFGPGK